MNTIKEWRIKNGVTQKRLGELTGLPNTVVWRHEHGYTRVSAKSALKYARVMQVPVEEILRDSGVDT